MYVQTPPDARKSIAGVENSQQKLKKNIRERDSAEEETAHEERGWKLSRKMLFALSQAHAVCLFIACAHADDRNGGRFGVLVRNLEGYRHTDEFQVLSFLEETGTPLFLGAVLISSVSFSPYFFFSLLSLSL